MPAIEEDYAVRAVQNGNTSSLPASWYHSEKMNALEKRAIFYKSWFLVTTLAQLSKPGDIFDAQLAGLHIYLKVEEDGNITAWHVEGSVHVHVTESGCVFVNPEAGVKPSQSFEEFFPGLEPILKTFPFRDFRLYKRFVQDAPMNWKTYVDGMTEYHCFVAHPGLVKILDIKTFKTENKGNYSQSWVDSIRPDNVEEKDFLGSEAGLFLVLYPMGGVNCFTTGWVHIYPSPLSSTVTRFTNDFYLATPSSTEQQMQEFFDASREIDNEDWELCFKTQANLNTGVYRSGTLHPVWEKEVIHYHALTKKLVMEHGALEKKMGRMVNPLVETDLQERPDTRTETRA